MARKTTCLLLLLSAALLGGCDWFVPDTSLDLSFSQLRRGTPQERTRSLFRIRQAWEFRPEGADDDGRKAERRFLNRYGAFAKTLVRTESARDAAQLWRRIYTDHQHRFPDAGD